MAGLKCSNCEAPMFKSAKFCIDCGAKNPAFRTSDERLDQHEKDLQELKAKKKSAKDESADDDDSLLS